MMNAPRSLQILRRIRGFSSTPSPVARLSPRFVLEPWDGRRRYSSEGPTTENHNAKVEIRDDGVFVELRQLGTPKRQTLPHFWLRDNCRCTKCVNQDTRQRNFNTFAIPTDIKPTEITTKPGGIRVSWSDSHQSFYPWQFIQFYQSNDHRQKENERLYLWGSEVASRPPTVSYEKVTAAGEAGETAVGELTAKIKKYGFVFVKGTPYDDPEHTKTLLERIAFIRLTHYGGFYDFTPNLAMADTAYTNLALPAHTDTTYFTDPAGLQAFHLLSHQPPTGVDPASEAAEGGASLLVDGFNAAKILQEEDPKAYEILATVRLPWHASGNEGITIAPDKRYPVLELDEDTGKLHRIRWNNDDRGVVPFGERFSPTEWYGAARKWDAILRRKESEAWIQLEPGKTLIFDNWRVMHGRSAFTGVRRICGAYINRDDFISRWRNTNLPRENILERIIG